jgi:hypothetical protein
MPWAIYTKQIGRLIVEDKQQGHEREKVLRIQEAQAQHKIER